MVRGMIFTTLRLLIWATEDIVHIKGGNITDEMLRKLHEKSWSTEDVVSKLGNGIVNLLKAKSQL